MPVCGSRKFAAANGPLIILSNHASRLDSIFYHQAVGVELTVCGARPEYFESLPKRIAMHILNVRKAENKEQFVTECCELLEDKRVVLLYPEMKTNRRGLGEFKTWAAEVAVRSGAPAVPCFITGTSRYAKSAVTIKVGKVIDLPSNVDAQSLTATFKQRIAALSTQEHIT